MYCLTSKDKDGYREFLFDVDTGMMYSYVTSEHAKAGMSLLKERIRLHLTTPVYESKPIAFGLLRRDVEVKQDPKEVAILRRIMDTLSVANVPSAIYNIREVKLNEIDD